MWQSVNLYFFIAGIGLTFICQLMAALFKHHLDIRLRKKYSNLMYLHVDALRKLRPRIVLSKEDLDRLFKDETE